MGGFHPCRNYLPYAEWCKNNGIRGDSMFNENDIKILTVLYFENQKTDPNYTKALNSTEVTGLSQRTALTKLDELGYIKGFLGAPKSKGSKDRFKSYRNILVTDKGADYISYHFKKDKLDYKGIAEQAASWGGIFVNLLGLL